MTNHKFTFKREDDELEINILVDEITKIIAKHEYYGEFVPKINDLIEFPLLVATIDGSENPIITTALDGNIDMWYLAPTDTSAITRLAVFVYKEMKDVIKFLNSWGRQWL